MTCDRVLDSAKLRLARVSVAALYARNAAFFAAVFFTGRTTFSILPYFLPIMRPHLAIYSSKGSNVLPCGVSAYSTRGGTSACTFRLTKPSFSN